MVYDQIMAMTEGGPGTSTTSIAVLIYKKGFGGGQFAYQSANAVMLFIVVVLISVFQLRILEKREEKVTDETVDTANVKERYNWPVTHSSDRRNRADHPSASVYGTDDRHQRSVRHEQYPGTSDKNIQSSELSSMPWNMTDFPRKFFNTAFITVINLIFTLITNSFAAYAITRNRKKSKFFSIHVLLLYQCNVHSVPGNRCFR